MHGHRRRALTAASAGIEVDLDDAVDQAVALGDRGNAFSRVYRQVAGGEVRRDLSPTSSYDRKAITKLLDRVEEGLHREPKGASVALEGGELRVTEKATTRPPGSTTSPTRR